MPPRLWTFVLLAAVMASARAQLRLPVPQLPALPMQVPHVSDPADRDLIPLVTARQREIERLIRTSNHRVEADRDGNPLVRGEILAVPAAAGALDQAGARGFLILREAALLASMRVVVLGAPPGLPIRRALESLRAADPDGTYDYNHIYGNTGSLSERPGPTAAGTPPAIAPAGITTARRIRVGLVDAGVAAGHPAFSAAELHLWGCNDTRFPSFHGTAVASLLVTGSPAGLYAADVYCGMPTGGAVDAIIGALAWLSGEQVAVINVSLVGPRNALLERAVAALIAQGHLIVAAVGNDGPAAPPLYPAAYPEVIGVTGVDGRRHALIEALRGPQVTFAAPGADIDAADLHGGVVGVRGTSFAAPTVAALLAELLTTPERAAAAEAVDSLARRAVDLGPVGKDLTYGYGFVDRMDGSRPPERISQ